VVATTVMEFYWGTRARMKATGEPPLGALWSLVDRNKRRYGGFVVHVGVILIIVGITGSSVFKQEATGVLARGESFAIGRFALRFEDVVSHDDPNREFIGARLAVLDGGRQVGSLTPGQNFYKAGQDPSSEVAIRSTLREDVYTIMTGFDPQAGKVTLKAYVNPLVAWIWIGGGVLIAGSWFAMLPDLRDRRREAEARLRAAESYATT
jgi:cytochrome c-type biogenesis protein CcmF